MLNVKRDQSQLQTCKVIHSRKRYNSCLLAAHLWNTWIANGNSNAVQYNSTYPNRTKQKRVHAYWCTIWHMLSLTFTLSLSNFYSNLSWYSVHKTALLQYVFIMKMYLQNAQKYGNRNYITTMHWCDVAYVSW